MTYTSKLGLKVHFTKVGAQKVHDSTLKTFGIVLASFQVEDKLEKVWFFQKTFLLANINMEIVLDMLFLILSNANIQFVQKELIWSFYTTSEALLTTKWVELINKKEFAKPALDENFESFVIHVASLNVALKIYPDKAAQIVSFLTKKVKIPNNYLDFVNVFSEKKTLVLPEHTKLNEHAINLENGKQPPYGPIYSLTLVELESLKTYIKNYLKTGFIQLSKSSAVALILFDKKPDGNFRLYVDYWGFNNFTIKNQYLLLLINESLDWLSQAKRFI